MSFAFARSQSRWSSKRAALYGLGLAGFGSLSLANYFTYQANLELGKIKAAKGKLADFKVQPLEGVDALRYPWANGNLENWEYKIVKVRGYFKTQRIYVRKYKDGKPGFAVFAPFVTSIVDGRTAEHRIANGKDIEESGIMVNLGWVPSENKNEVSGTDEPLPLVEWGENHPYHIDSYTGFEYKPKYDEEKEEVKPKYTDLTAIVRAGEKKSVLHGLVNWEREGYLQFIDLDFFSRLFLFRNFESSRVAYLERVVPSLDDSSLENTQQLTTKSAKIE